MKKKDNITHRKWEHSLAAAALLLLTIAWIAGNFRAQGELLPYLQQLYPGAGYFEPLSDNLFSAWQDENKTEALGYLSVTETHGYGGNMKIITAVSSLGLVENILIAGHKETPSFFRRVEKRGFVKSLQGKSYADPFSPDDDIDGISGATYTCRALAEAVRKGSRSAAKNILGLTVPPEPIPAVKFGFPEIVLLVLFLLGYVGTRRWVKFKKTIRRTTLLAALIFIGFIYNNPLNLVLINKMLLGYWPGWRLNIYLYILLAGVFLPLIFEKRNIYCERVCPFGAVQEGLKVIGGGKVKVPGKVSRWLRWLQRLLALSAIGIALYLKNPGLTGFEVFGVFFRLVGSDFIFILLGVTLVLSLFIKRPWCNYLCPNRAVSDYILLLNRRVREKIAGKRVNRKEETESAVG
jgi:NosR/NirI family nitrous oxide reductase transcriptional regulator